MPPRGSRWGARTTCMIALKRIDETGRKRRHVSRGAEHLVDFARMQLLGMRPSAGRILRASPSCLYEPVRLGQVDAAWVTERHCRCWSRRAGTPWSTSWKRTTPTNISAVATNSWVSRSERQRCRPPGEECRRSPALSKRGWAAPDRQAAADHGGAAAAADRRRRHCGADRHLLALSGFALPHGGR